MSRSVTEAPTGHVIDGDASERVRRSGPSLRPALVVVAIAAGLILLFGVGAALTGRSSPAPPPVGQVPGARLAAVQATSALRPIERPGTPPSDVLGALVVPARVTTVASAPWNGSTQYSAKISFRVPASQEAVVSFYRSELHARGWGSISTGAARGRKGATEVLAQKASSDGWYWEVGVVVSPTTFGSSPGSAADVTRFSIELFQVPDSS